MGSPGPAVTAGARRPPRRTAPRVRAADVAALVASLQAAEVPDCSWRPAGTITAEPLRGRPAAATAAR